MTGDLSTNDVQLIANDIGVLENADQVVNLFARLGYDVDDSIALSHAALGLETTDLAYQIQAIRRVGEDPEDGDIVIYLFEVRSVTVALTQQIARRFRERTENPLLVLTSDYESLDFVLVERELASGKRPGSALRQVIRPRTLTVKRRNPSSVNLRVLKRFTCTEGDAAYQWEKLRSAFTLAEWTEEYFNNRALFSDYYLLERLTDPRQTSAWNEDVRPMGRQVFRHMVNARPTYSNQPEATIRQGFFEPIFTALGFEFEVQKDADSDLETPDYALYASSDRDKPLALAMTYVWNRNLDDMDESRNPDTPDEIPGAHVVNVLARSEADWVFVTNGKLWRLYSSTADNKATNYYEIDLEEAVTAPGNDQVTALKYWWLFFRRQAVEGFLDDLLQQSADYARALGDRLKDRVFSTIFPHFGEGFIRQARAVGEDDPDLDLVFVATMTFLYRLMFILYAESLNLLPVTEERGYGALSLRRLKRELAEVGGIVEEEAPDCLRAHYAEDSTALYQRLQQLFTAIDIGGAALNLPIYNGGLFSERSAEGRFLAEYAIPDTYLALGLDRLCRDVDDKTLALAAIDFKSLGVRQLGSIYEGLLEFKLRVADEKLVVVKEKGKEVYLPAGKAGKKRVVTALEPGDVYLANDKAERKATGSYYTPDYIVKYIVEQTVGPVLERKFEELAPRLGQAQKAYRQHKETVAARGNDQSPALFWKRAEMAQLADDCLNVRVLDPAMGSGHFLVEAVDFISDKLIGFLNGWSENPVWGLLERTRQEILADMERQGVSIDAERLTRVSLLKRSVLKRCIYGVDLNAMAVELAKVSLWLDAFTLGAPLSFLDHHLKWGNSLIGARVGEVEAALGSGQLSLFAQSQFAGVMLATDLMRQVSFLSDNTADQLAESRAAFRSARDHLSPYKRMLDVYTSRWFGNHPNVKKADAFDPCVEFLQRTEVEAWLRDPERAELPPEDLIDMRHIGETALAAAAAKRFFHWELEFPEVFFAPSRPGGQDVDLREDGGFDAVVGNPPYSDIKGLDQQFVGYLFGAYEHMTFRVNIFAAFMEQALLSCLSPTGLLGLIVPTAVLTQVSYSDLRKQILGKWWIRSIVRLPNEIFGEGAGEVKVDTCVIAIGKAKGTEKPVSQVLIYEGFIREETISAATASQAFVIPQDSWNAREEATITLVNPREADLLKKIEGLSSNLDKICKFCLGITPYDKYQGHTPDQIKQKIFHADSKLSGSHKRLLVSGDVFRYQVRWNGSQWLDYGDWLAAPREQKFFTDERLLIQQIIDWSSLRLLVGWTDEELYNTQNQFNLLPIGNTNLKYVLAILNSTLMTYFHRKAYLDVALQRFQKVLIKDARRFPIRSICFDTQADRRLQLRESWLTVYRQHPSEDIGDTLDFVDCRLDQEESDAVHDILAILAEQMIDLNKREQAEVKRFLAWVEETLGMGGEGRGADGGIDSFTGKTILQNYLGDYQKGEKELPWDDFEYRLHQNRRRYPADLAQVKGRIQTEYEASLAVLLPIKAQLAQTDGLIDQIVYKLYGLTDEEIAIIERPAYEAALSQAKAKVVADEKLQADPDAAADVMAEALLPAAQRLRQQVALSAERASLDQALPGWHLFPDAVATFLVTAEYNIHTQPDYLDFSTSIISYAKAVETMLYHRLFMRFRDESGASDADCSNKFLQQFMRGERHLTLGSINIILKSSKEAALRAYVEGRYPGRFFAADGLVERLNDEENLAQRNAAAHDQALTRQDAQSARAWAFGILGSL